MGALQPVLTFLIAPSAWPVPLPAVDLAAVTLAVWIGWVGRMAPGHARALLLAGVLVAGLGPLLASAAVLVPPGAGLASEAARGAAAGAPETCAVIGLLFVAAGCARLEYSARGARRRARLLEALCLVLTAVGVAVAQLAASVLNGINLLVGATLPLNYVATAGWAAALAGAVGVVAADTSGRASGPVPYRRRVFAMYAAALYAAAVAVLTALGAWGTGVPASGAILAHLALGAALLLLAGGVHRVLDRPAAADYWHGEGAATARKRDHARRKQLTTPGSPRIVPTPPTTIVPPARHVPGGIAWQEALAGSSARFTPPALRRSLLLESADGAVRGRTVSSGGRVPPPEPMVVPAVADPAVADRSGGAFADVDTNRLGPGARDGLDTNLAPRAAFSPQFVAALLHLQAEMLRAGRTYSFEELVALFEAVQPRSSRGPWHGRPPRAAQPDSALGTTLAAEVEAPLTSAPPPGDDFTDPSPSPR